MGSGQLVRAPAAKIAVCVHVFAAGKPEGQTVSGKYVRTGMPSREKRGEQK